LAAAGALLLVTGPAAARPAADTASPAAGVAPDWLLHALTRSPGMATASAAASTQGDRPFRTERVTGVNTQASWQRSVRG
jgi:hypothetical protein